MKGEARGKAEGLEEGFAKGRENEKHKIARNLLAKGSTPEFIQEITGLDMETIQGLND
jgi:predicted transposase/invertase (TIGR01784 family)